MTTIDFEKVASIYEKSPEYVKDFLMSEEAGLVISDIAEESELTEEQYYNLVDEIGYIALGISSKDGLHDSLVEKNVEESKTSKLISEVQNKVLPILEKLKNTKKITIQELIGDETEELMPKKEAELKERIEEIGTKYGLEEGKRAKLIDVALSTLTNKEDKEQIEDNLVTSLGISRILAEQIHADLEKRVFEYALTLNQKRTATEKEENKVEPPSNLPGDEMAHVEPAMPRKEIDVPMYTATPKSAITNEPIQKPLEVPRFTSTEANQPSFTKPASIPKKVETLNIIDAKLSKVTPGMAEKPATEQKMPTTKYTVDPYREPLQ